MSIFSRYMARQAQLREVRAALDIIPEAELEGLGVTRAQFFSAASMPAEQNARMIEVAHRFGIDLDGLRDIALHNQIAATCANCVVQGACKSAVARGAGPEDLQFCPNADTFQALG